MSDFYDNLLKATNNIDDITTEKYGVITKLDGLYCSVKETDNDLEHNNVPIINGANLSVGDKAIIGFLNNSIYDVVCYGALDKTIHDDSKQDLLVSGTNIKTINHQSLLGSGNITIEGGGTGVDIVTSWSNPTTDTSVPSEKLTKDTLDLKLDSSDAFSGDYEDLNNKPTIPSKITDLTNDSNFIEKSSTNGLVKNDGTIDTTNYSTFDGNYNSLTNKPTIPSKTSDLTNDGDGTNPFLTQHQSLANYVQKSSTSGLLKNDGSVDTTQYLSSLPSHNHDDRYYTESEVDTALSGKQATLVSGTNIKTINNTSLLGSGNISIQGGGSVTVDSALSTTSENPVQNKVITGALNGKADTSSLSTVATSGSYNDLSNKPNIPTAISDLTNDSDFIETSSTTGLIKNDGSIDTNTYLTQHQDVSTWTSQAIATYGTLYVNTALRLCEFRYYRTSYNFSSTAQVTLHSAVIPSTYRPKYTYYLASWDNQVSMAVTENGDIMAYTSSKATRNIFATGMWHY